MAADERLNFWERAGGKGRWGIGVAVDILAIEARLAALESSRPVQPATETAAEGANDPGRDNAAVPDDPVRRGVCRVLESIYDEPQTLPPRETWPPHIRPRDEATDEPEASDGPGDGYRWVRADGPDGPGEVVEPEDEFRFRGEWKPVKLRGLVCDHASQKTFRRRITPVEAVPDDAAQHDPVWAVFVNDEKVPRSCYESEFHAVKRGGEIRGLSPQFTVSVVPLYRRPPAEAVPSPDLRGAALPPGGLVYDVSGYDATTGWSVWTPRETGRAVPDDAARFPVGDEVSLHDVLAAERVAALEALWKCRDELRERRAKSERDGQEIARLTAERDAEKQRFQEYEHAVMTGRSEQHDRLVAERDAARAEVERTIAARNAAIGERDEFRKSWLSATDHATRLVSQRDAALAEVERHRMTGEEREAAWSFGSVNGSPSRRDPDGVFAVVINKYLNRTKEVK